MRASSFDAARRRSFVVLQRMREEKKITPEQEQLARAEQIRIRPQPSVSNARHGYAKEYLRQQFRDIYGGDNPRDWKVRTTFVPELQDAAEAAVRDGLRQLGVKGLQAALVAMDPSTGNLLAMVGGCDFSVTPYNRAIRSRRQPGSVFKPFVYLSAFDYAAREGRTDLTPAAADEAGLEAPVPTCPGWTVNDLVLHMGEVHRWAMFSTVRTTTASFCSPSSWLSLEVTLVSSSPVAHWQGLECASTG